MRLLVLLLIMTIAQASAVFCIDGTDCDTNCGICEGAGCLRITGQHPTKGPTVALTCLPYDAYIHLTHPEGCRTDLTTQKKTCLCSESDFCNGTSPRYQNLVIFVFVLLCLY